MILNKTATIFFNKGMYFSILTGKPADKVQDKEALYWKMVECMWAQLEGMYDGYSERVTNSSRLTFQQFSYLTYMGDLEDIVPGAIAADKPAFDCTTFTKPYGDNIIVSHNTHNRYSLMLRVFKVFSRKVSVWFWKPRPNTSR